MSRLTSPHPTDSIPHGTLLHYADADQCLWFNMNLHQKQIIIWWCQCVMVITTKRVGDEFLVENYVWSMTERCRFSIIISICLVNSSSSIVWRHLCKIISQNFYILWHKTPEAPTLVSQKCLSSPLTFGDAFILLHRVNIDKGFFGIK